MQKKLELKNIGIGIIDRLIPVFTVIMCVEGVHEGVNQDTLTVYL